MQIQANTILLFLGVVLIWLLALTVFTFNAVNHYRKLTKGTQKKSIDRILEEILARYDLTSNQINQLKSQFEKLEDEQKQNIQKIALIRFNPFEDTGGDQSFVTALLSKSDNGIVISSLHSRGGTRIYAKQVSKGKSTTYKFSKEEKEVVERAARQNS